LFSDHQLVFYSAIFPLKMLKLVVMLFICYWWWQIVKFLSWIFILLSPENIILTLSLK